MVLEKILAVKRAEVSELKKTQAKRPDLSGLPPARDFRGALQSADCAIIAEVKRKSPSKGMICEGLDPVELAGVYEKNGAAAISVLTDRDFFGGSGEDLRNVKRSVGVPILRKDFIIDTSQVYEARMIGADAVLLIARVLEQGALEDCIETARSLGMAALVEVHDIADAEKVAGCGAEIIGINNRDLSTFVTDIGTTLELLAFLPAEKIIVSESGIHSRADIELLQQAGVNAFLIGEALVKAEDPALKLREFLGR